MCLLCRKFSYMAEIKRNTTGGFHWRKLLQYFLQGLVIIAPVGVTLYVVLYLFNTVDDILPNLIHRFIPGLLGTDAQGYPKKIPGVGFLVVILFVILVGRISSSFVMSRLVELLDSLLERTPGVKFIYTSIKDFLEAFTGNKRKFNKPVLATVDAPDVWRIGFITQEDAADFELKDYMVVYIPLAYALTGVTYFVPIEKVKKLDHISSAEAMKFAVSGGVSHVE